MLAGSQFPAEDFLAIRAEDAGVAGFARFDVEHGAGRVGIDADLRSCLEGIIGAFSEFCIDGIGKVFVDDGADTGIVSFIYLKFAQEPLLVLGVDDKFPVAEYLVILGIRFSGHIPCQKPACVGIVGLQVDWGRW